MHRKTGTAIPYTKISVFTRQVEYRVLGWLDEDQLKRAGSYQTDHYPNHTNDKGVARFLSRLKTKYGIQPDYPIPDRLIELIHRLERVKNSR
ncbi:MAG: hypothetical protein AAF437_02605 [Pseudomonadota bacterium]